jgi:hypothetical protein
MAGFEPVLTVDKAAALTEPNCAVVCGRDSTLPAVKPLVRSDPKGTHKFQQQADQNPQIMDDSCLSIRGLKASNTYNIPIDFPPVKDTLESGLVHVIRQTQIMRFRCGRVVICGT